MTHDEARAQFPVFERYAYLNAGSSGPLPRAAVEAVRARLERDLTEGRSGKAYIEEIFELRERIRSGHRSRPRHLRGARRAHRVDDPRLPGRRRRARPRPGRRDRHDRPGALRPARPAPRQRRPCRRDGGRRGRAARRRDPANAADRRLARPLDDWTQARSRAAPAAGRPAAPRRRRAVGRRDPGRSRRRRLLHRVARRNGFAAPIRRARSSCAIRSGCAWRCRARSRRRATRPDGSFVPEGRRARGSTPAGSARRRSPASRRRSGCTRSGATRVPPAAAARCRELLAPLVDVVTPPGQSTLVSFRPPGDPAELVAALARARRDRPRAAGPQPRPRLVRLVDERGRPAPARGRARRVARARPRSAAAPRRSCGCGRRARRRDPPRPCRPRRDGRRPRTTAASASS